MGVKTLESACRNYYTEYQQLPLNANLITNNSDLVYTLTASNAGATASAALNPKSVVFIELPCRKDAFAPAKGGFLDPWGNPYHVTLIASNQVNVWSSGPNGKDESGQGDDITSWR